MLDELRGAAPPSDPGRPSVENVAGAEASQGLAAVDEARGGASETLEDKADQDEADRETETPVAEALADPPAAPRPVLPDLIPIRMLNEFAYCPRLAYLEWVQGEWADNLDTLEGTFGHRNVDSPGRKEVPTAAEAAPRSEESAANGDGKEPAGSARGKSRRKKPAAAEAPEPEVLHARSLLLSAPGEGLTAKLDLLELEGSAATPVDYKRGSAPDIPEGAYEPERVQLCAQGLILRENGYQCDRGVIYFIESRKRVTIEFDDALVARTRQLVVEFREAAVAKRMPPPLVDSPKCPRCSLVGICLPDETNLLRRMAAADQIEEEVTRPGTNALPRENEITWARPDQPNEPPEKDESRGNGSAARHDGLRQLIPTRDDALPLYLQDQGLTLGKDGDNLVVKKKGEHVKDVRFIDVSQVCLFGSVHVTEPALRELATRGTPVCHFSYGGWFYAITSGLVHKNVELRIRQYATAAEPALALAYARRFIVGKIRNCRTLIRRHLDAPDKPRLMWQLSEYVKKAERAGSAESLLGIEGTAAKLYFSAFGRLLNGGEEFDIDGRNRRPPKDPVNALLSFLYSLLTKELTVTLQAVGFDPMLGVYHQPRYGRPSLALDLAEEFRPLIADSTVLTLINNGEVTPASFIRRAGAVTLTDAGRRAVLSAFERRLGTEITHPLFGYTVCYRRILQVQSRLLARALLGELPEYPSFVTR